MCELEIYITNMYISVHVYTDNVVTGHRKNVYIKIITMRNINFRYLTLDIQRNI